MPKQLQEADNRSHILNLMAQIIFSDKLAFKNTVLQLPYTSADICAVV
jgi:hypothetical protein